VDHTGLAALEAADDWTPPPVPEAASEEFKKLGCLYWLLVFFFCPGALIWGFVLPKNHPQRKMAILVPLVFMVVSVLLAVLFILVMVIAVGQGLSELEPEVTFSTSGDVTSSDGLIPMGASYENLPVFPGMVLEEADVRVPGGDPLATMDPALRSSLTAVAPADYETVFDYYKEVMEDGGWQIVSSGIMRAPEQSASISAYDDKQTIWVGMKPEGSGTRVNIAIGPLSPP
jgi:hypothetical protein